MLLHKARLEGGFSYVASKSCLIRAIFAAFIAGNGAVFKRFTPSEDVSAAINAVTALGAIMLRDGNSLFFMGFRGDDFIDKSVENMLSCLGKGAKVYGSRVGVFDGVATINCMESATVFRLLLPLCAAKGLEADFLLGHSLAQRPHDTIIDFLNAHGCTVKREGNKVLLRGKMIGNDYEVDGALSSQFASGMLLAIAARGGGSLKINSLCSKGYVDLTLKYLGLAGYMFSEGERHEFTGSYRRSWVDYEIENCFSSNAYWLAGGAISGRAAGILDCESMQPDSAIINVLRSANANIITYGGVVATAESDLCAFSFDASKCPDLVPVIAVLACNAKGESVISGTERLRYKESDRIKAVADLMTNLGVKHRILENEMWITGAESFSPKAPVNSYRDHRIVMAAAIASLTCDNLIIKDPEVVDKSYPGFFKEYYRLIGKRCGGTKGRRNSGLLS